MGQNGAISFQKILKIMFETSPDMLVFLDKNGKILDCNEIYAQSFGYQKEELMGMNGPIDMVSEKDRQKAVSAMGALVSEGVKTGVPLEVIKKDGVCFPSVWSGAALHNEQGHLEGYLITGKDLSEIEYLKNKIEKSEEKSQQEKMTMLGEVTSRVAHDIRNPLSNINMSINLMKQSNPDIKISDKSIQEKLDVASKNLERISHQVNEVLDFIRIHPLKKENISLSSCISSALDCIFIPKSIKVEINGTDVDINGDRDQLQIVFVNLLVNSVQSIGDNDGTIQIKTSKEPQHAIIEIFDSGKEIPEEILPSLFESMTTTKQKGTGLGLISCKNIIQNHKGIVFAKNAPKVFTIKLPIE
ncbi:MAG: PAS domain S-box protein [Nitrosopumilaceae archaeon]|jgi:PAS domain S-box-containing protein